MRRALAFGFAGGVGFLVDAIVLWLLLSTTPLGPFLSRIVSISIALTATWILNRQLTFRPSSRGIALEGARYGGVGVMMSVANYLIYSGLLLAIPALPPLAALGAASAAAMILSYMGYSRLVFDR